VAGPGSGALRAGRRGRCRHQPAGLAEPVDPTPRRFHGRDIRVLDAGRFTDALTRAITDPQVGELVDALGRRADGTVACLPGAIDQAVDTVDILTHPARCRAAAPALGAVAVD